MEDYYRLLGIDQGAPDEEIRTKLRECKQRWVRRANAPTLERRQEAERLLALVPNIEEALLDPARRAEYDRSLRVAPPPIPDIAPSRADVCDPDTVRAGWRLAVAGNIPDALAVALQATRQHPDNPDAWALSAYAKAQWGELDEAIQEYRMAVKLRPNDAELYFDLGLVYEAAERWAEALEQYRRAAQIDPSKSVYRAGMGAVFIKNGMFQEGIDLLERCLNEEPDNEGYKYLLAVAYIESTYQHWTYVPPGSHIQSNYYATTIAQVEEAEVYLSKAESLRSNDRDVIERVRQARENIAAMRKRRFHGNWLAAGAACVVGVVSFLSGDANVMPAGVYWLACGGLYIASCMTPQYRLNRRVIQGGGTPGVMGLLTELGAGDAGCFVLLFGFIVILTVMPIMIIWNFVKNYALK